MAVAYAPFEDPRPLAPTRAPATPSKVPKGVEMDNTECNYVVLLFVVGTFVLAIVDSFKK